MSKPKVIKDYDKLTEDVVEQIKLVYPMGFTSHLISFTNRHGEKRKGLPFETEKYYYLIRMSEAKAKAIIEDDDDYDRLDHFEEFYYEEDELDEDDLDDD